MLSVKTMHKRARTSSNQEVRSVLPVNYSNAFVVASGKGLQAPSFKAANKVLTSSENVEALNSFCSSFFAIFIPNNLPIFTVSSFLTSIFDKTCIFQLIGTLKPSGYRGPHEMPSVAKFVESRHAFLQSPLLIIAKTVGNFPHHITSLDKNVPNTCRCITSALYLGF